MSYSSVDEVLEYFDEIEAEVLYPTDLKDAIIGVVERFGLQPLILLDRDKCIEIFMKRDGMSFSDANEFFEFNTIGAWMGEGTPCFATLIKQEKKTPVHELAVHELTVKVKPTTKPLDCQGVDASSGKGKIAP